MAGLASLHSHEVITSLGKSWPGHEALDPEYASIVADAFVMVCTLL